MVEYYTLTTVGVQRLQTGTLRGMDPAEVAVMKAFGELQGTAEFDELSNRTLQGPLFTRVVLNKLIGKGLVAPVSLEQQGVESGASQVG